MQSSLSSTCVNNIKKALKLAKVASLFATGVFIMAAFIRAAQRVEPFTRRA